VRARQAAQLLKHLTDFAQRHKADDVPVVLVGDMNAQHFGEIRGIARTVFQVSGHPCHSFLFNCADVPTGPTSMTDCRQVRIDAIMFPPKQLKVLGIYVPDLKNKIPDETQPSDHVCIRTKFEVKADHRKLFECALSWLECVMGESRIMPMTEKDIQRAFTFFDRDGSGFITQENLQDSCLDMENVAFPPEKQSALLACFPLREISFDDFTEAYEQNYNTSRIANIGDLERAFNFFDSDNDGKVTADDIRNAFFEIVPIEFTDDEVDCMIAQISGNFKDQDGIDVHEFCTAMCSCNFSCTSGESKKRALQARGSKVQLLAANLERARNRDRPARNSS